MNSKASNDRTNQPLANPGEYGYTHEDRSSMERFLQQELGGPSFGSGSLSGALGRIYFTFNQISGYTFF